MSNPTDPRDAAICAVISHHIQANTPIGNYTDFYKEAATTLEQEHGFNISQNTLQKRYDANWKAWGGKDARKHCQKAMRTFYRRNPALKNPTYPDPTEALAKMHEPMEKSEPRERDEFAEDMGASLEAARDDQTASFSDTLSIRPAPSQAGERGRQQDGNK